MCGAKGFLCMGYDSLRAGQRVFIPADWEVVIAWPPLSLVARASSRQREHKRSQWQQITQVVALADRADVAGVLFLCPRGDAAGQSQPDFRVQFDDVRRGQVMRV